MKQGRELSTNRVPVSFPPRPCFIPPQGGTIATMTYDALSRRTLLADWTGLYTATYDPDNRLIGMVGPTSIPITYAYDAIGQRAQVTIPIGVFSYTYDPANRLTLLINPEGDNTSYRYNAASLVRACLMANGTRASYSYDNANRLFGLANIGPGTAILPYACIEYNYLCSGQPQSSTFFARSAWRVARFDRLRWRTAA
jgi:YD repeat-containing protein